MTRDNGALAGQRFLVWLARAAIDARNRAGARPEEIAAPLRVGVDKIRRFEAAKSMPREIDQVLAVYAELAGLDDPRQIYQQALDLWYAHGTAPLISAKSDEQSLRASQRFEEQLRARRAHPRAPAGSEQRTSATRKRRASS